MADPTEDRHLWVAGTKVLLLRRLRRWTQADFAEASGIDASQISRYETGEDMPRPQTLERLAQSAGVSPSVLELMDSFLWTLARGTSDVSSPATPVTPAPDLMENLKQGVWGTVDRAMSLLLFELSSHVEHPAQPQADSDEARVEILWERLRQYGTQARRLLVEGARAYRDWRLCVRVCVESERATPRDPAEAVEMAELAVFIAEHQPETEGRRQRLQGCAWLFLGNARRVANTLALAEEAFSRGWELWRAGEECPGLWEEGYLLDLEASLRREQRLFDRALELHDRALQTAGPEATGVILVNKAITLEEQGKLEEALLALGSASDFIDRLKQPRLFFALQFTRASNLLKLGRAVEATPFVRDARTLVGSLGNELDEIRVRWLEGQLAIEREAWSDALKLLESVRAHFEGEGLSYDCALATLDLALVYSQLGRFSEVLALATQMIDAFRKQGIGRETIASLLLLKESAERQQVSVELVRGVKDRLVASHS
jgi:transcriptional regulator with XRE-family HTH domain